MKSSFLFLLASCLFLAACQNNDAIEQGAAAALTKEKKVMQAFSDSVLLDTFKLVKVGETAKDLSLLFTITSHTGVQIYKEEIKAQALLKSYLASADLKKEAEQLKFINDEMEYFFDEEHFLIPAVTAEEQPDNNVPDKAFYEELKKSGLNGFDYRLGKDTKIYIAWSAKDQKVKVYYKCCVLDVK